MRRALLLAAITIAACHRKAEPPVVVPIPERIARPPVDDPSTITDFTATRDAACAQLRDGVYRCWGSHAAFSLMRGEADPEQSGRTIELPMPLPALGKLRRLVLTDSGEAWAVTEGGELLAWSDVADGLERRFEAWKPAVGGDIRDVAVSDGSLCVRRGADIACWHVALMVGRFDARTLAGKGQIARSPDGGPAAIGRLHASDAGVQIDTAGGCRSLEDFYPRAEGDEPDNPPLHGRCGALDRERLAELALPPGVDAVRRGSCVLIENVRLWCSASTPLEARVGSTWNLVPRIVAARGASRMPRGSDCTAADKSIECSGKSYPLPAGTVQQVVSSGSNRDDARGTWVVASDGVVYATESAPKLVRLGSGKPPVEVVGHGARTCSLDAAGVVACQRFHDPYARVRGLPKIEKLWTADDGWLARDTKGKLWSITRTEASGSQPVAVRVRDVGIGEPLLLLDNGTLIRAPSGALHVLGAEGVITPLAADDPLATLMRAETWVQLVRADSLVCGRSATGTVGCTLVGEVPFDAPIGIERDPALARPPLTFAAVELFEADGMCATGSDGSVACWGPAPRRDGYGWVDVTDRL